MKARVLEFAATYGGGMATHVATLAGGLDREKYEVRTLCPDVGELRRRLAGLGIPFDCVPVATEMDVGGDLTLFRFLLAYLQRHRFDIVHTHSTKAGFWGRIAARMCGVPVVLYTAHAYRFLRYRMGSVPWAAYVAIEWFGGRFGGTIAVGPSEGLLARSLHLAPRGRQFTVNNGVEVPDVRSLVPDPGVRTRLGLPAGCPLVLTIGRLMYQKGPLTFVEVAGQVARQHASVRFVMVGDGDLEPSVRERAAQLGISGRLHIIPKTDEVPALLLEADLFVMTSLYEGLSYAAAEAGAYRRALVLSDVPGLRDLVEQDRSGVLVSAGNVVGFAEAILRLLGDPTLRQSLGASAARFIATNFNVKQMVTGTERVYDELLALRGRRP